MSASGTLTFRLDEWVYTVTREGFEKGSKSLFPDMLALPQADGGSPEGSVTNPIRLVGCTVSEFETLLLVMHGQGAGGAPAVVIRRDEWEGALRLARMWDMPAIALRCIEGLASQGLTALEKIALGRRFGVERWFLEAYTSVAAELLSADGPAALATHAKAVGWETLARVLWSYARSFRGALKFAEPFSVGVDDFVCPLHFCGERPGTDMGGVVQIHCWGCMKWCREYRVAPGTLIPARSVVLPSPVEATAQVNGASRALNIGRPIDELARGVSTWEALARGLWCAVRADHAPLRVAATVPVGQLYGCKPGLLVAARDFICATGPQPAAVQNRGWSTEPKVRCRACDRFQTGYLVAPGTEIPWRAVKPADLSEALRDAFRSELKECIVDTV